MTSTLIEVAILADGWNARPEAEALIRKAMEAALRLADRPAPSDAEVSVALLDDARMRALNRDFRGVDKPTNVLSFPSGGGPFLGDVAIALETTEREASDDGLPFDAHLMHLAAHGLLHLLGYDHEDEAEAVIMERLETRILTALGRPDPHVGGRTTLDGNNDV